MKYYGTTRTNQNADSQSKDCFQTIQEEKGMPDNYELYVCRKCGHEVLSIAKPYPIQWADGHVCNFKLHKEPNQNEQHSKVSEDQSEADR